MTESLDEYWVVKRTSVAYRRKIRARSRTHAEQLAKDIDHGAYEPGRGFYSHAKGWRKVDETLVEYDGYDLKDLA